MGLTLSPRPHAVGTLDITADLRGSRVIVSVDLDAPRDGRAATRVNWLTRQLKEAPVGLRIDARAANQRTSTSELLGVARDNPAVLITDPQKDLRQFRIAAVTAMGTKRGTGRASFIDSVLAAVEGFYGAVLQQLRPWTSKAPQLPAGLKSAAETAGIDTRPPAVDLAALAESDVPADETDAVDATPVDTEPVDDDREVVRWDLDEARLEHERRDATEPDVSDQPDSTENVDND